ncbi:thioesterase family protein [Achromobacter sp. F4_2707]|uniref:acyl-CoA thioesterase n=1 Tax=Achromobacter sp. F4_2707 TaxID=3114286 RepID=UPI0039C61692
MELQSRLNEQVQAGTGECFRLEIPVRWGDHDSHDHVNNTVYFRFMEETRVHCARACGIGGRATNRDIVVANVSCTFLRPIHWPAIVVVEKRLKKVGRSSVEFEDEISVKGEEGLCARGQTVVVGLDRETGRPAPWSQAELEGMAKVFAIPVA